VPSILNPELNPDDRTDYLMKKLRFLSLSPMAVHFPEIKSFLTTGGRRVDAARLVQQVEEKVERDWKKPWTNAHQHQIWLYHLHKISALNYPALDLQGSLLSDVRAAGIKAEIEHQQILRSLDAVALFRYNQIPGNFRADLPPFMREWVQKEEERVFALWKQHIRQRWPKPADGHVGP